MKRCLIALVCLAAWATCHGEVSPRALTDTEIRLDLSNKIRTVMANNSAWMLPMRNRKLGFESFGDTSRLRVALNKLLGATRKSFMLSTIGGSVTEGLGGTDRNPAWPVKLRQLLAALFPNVNVTLNNGARGATGSTYMQLCISQHVKKESDLIMIEYAVNDPLPRNTLDTPQRRAVETLIRKALDYPNRPGLVYFNYYSWFVPGKVEGFENYSQVLYMDPIERKQPFVVGNGVFWGNAERDYSELCRYYHLPTLSLKTACYELFLQNKKNFQVKRGPASFFYWNGDPASKHERPDTSEVSVFYVDLVHPYSSTGHRVMAELAFHALLVILLDLLETPLTLEDEIEANRTLSPPMFKNNVHTSSSQCWFKENFKEIVVESIGFEFVNEAHGGRSKWGFVSTKPGSKLVIRVNTSSYHQGQNMTAHLGMMRSYEHMGWARRRCEGCQCATEDMNLTHADRISPIEMWSFQISKHDNCTIIVEVLDTAGPSDEHKVKVTGLSIAQDDDEAHDGVSFMKNFAADDDARAGVSG